MKRTAVILSLMALIAFAPSAFACWKCDTTQGCYGTDVGVPGRTNCDFDGTCHLMGFCQGFADDSTQLAASYTVAAVRVVDTKAEKAPALTIDLQQTPVALQKEARTAAVTR